MRRLQQGSKPLTSTNICLARSSSACRADRANRSRSPQPVLRDKKCKVFGKATLAHTLVDNYTEHQRLCTSCHIPNHEALSWYNSSMSGTHNLKHLDPARPSSHTTSLPHHRWQRRGNTMDKWRRGRAAAACLAMCKIVACNMCPEMCGLQCVTNCTVCPEMCLLQCAHCKHNVCPEMHVLQCMS